MISDSGTTDGPAPERWFGVGSSSATDAAVAGSEAAATATAGRDASLLLVFSSLEDELPRLVDAVREHAGPETAIMGCSTCGEITRTGVAENSVVAVALGGGGFAVRTAIGRDAGDGGQRAAGVTVATEVSSASGDDERPHQALLLLPDGLVGRQHEIVRGVYSILGATVPMAGGCAGNLTYTKGYQFWGDRSGVDVVSGGVVAALIRSNAPIGIGAAHGWRPCGEPMNLTSSEDNRIYQLDHEPALDVYLRRLSSDDSVTTDPGGFFNFAHAHPLGLARRNGEDIRVIQSADLEDRSVTCFADVQQGSLVWMLETDQAALTSGGQVSCREAVANLGGAPPIGVLEFDCAVRKIMLGPDGVVTETAGMVDAVGNAPLAGYYSMGEVARARGMRGMHNMTSVTLALA